MGPWRVRGRVLTAGEAITISRMLDQRAPALAPTGRRKDVGCIDCNGLHIYLRDLSPQTQVTCHGTIFGQGAEDWAHAWKTCLLRAAVIWRPVQEGLLYHVDRSMLELLPIHIEEEAVDVETLYGSHAEWIVRLA